MLLLRCAVSVKIIVIIAIKTKQTNTATTLFMTKTTTITIITYLDRVAEFSDDDEEAEFSSGEFNDEANDLGIPGYDPKRDYNPSKHDMRKYRKLQRSEVDDVVALSGVGGVGSNNPVDSDSEFEMKDKTSSRAKISRVSI